MYLFRVFVFDTRYHETRQVRLELCVQAKSADEATERVENDPSAYGVDVPRKHLMLAAELYEE